MSSLALIGRFWQASKHMPFGKLRNRYGYESLLYLLIGLYKWKLTPIGVCEVKSSMRFILSFKFYESLLIFDSEDYNNFYKC